MAINPTNLSATATLTFEDNFDTLQLYDPANPSAGGWNTNYRWGAANGSTLTNNGEEQWYINNLYAPTTLAISQGTIVNPWTVNNGILTLTAAPVTDAATQQLINGYDYSSGMIQTAYSFSQTYGYFEMSAKLPAGQGLWPAFWLLPVDGSWPPEIDIMEVLGHQTSTLYTTVHYNGRGGRHQSIGTATQVADMSADFHTYGVNWQADYITWYFDDQQIFKTQTPAGMDKPMYILANLAVGGNWPGAPNSSTHFPAEYQIDYIRAYTDKPSTDPGPDPTPTGPLFKLDPTPAPDTIIAGNRLGRGDTLVGTLGNDLLDGNAGETTPQIDMLKGGAGHDTYVVDRTNDKVIEEASNGNDTIKSTSPKFTLPAEVEHLTLIGNAPQTGIGNSLNNRLTSNDYGSTLSGGDGNDILIAGVGADTLTGGAGTDIFQFDRAPAAAGHVKDFAAGDMLDLRVLFKTATSFDPTIPGADPLAQGYVSFASDGAGGTRVYFDVDGGLGPETLITTLDAFSGVLQAQRDWFYA